MTEIARKPVVFLPYDPRFEMFCPSCNSLSTEWHPESQESRHERGIDLMVDRRWAGEIGVPGWGLCHACGFQWRMPA